MLGITRAQFAQDLSRHLALVAQGADDEVSVMSGGAVGGPGQRTLPVSPWSGTDPDRVAGEAQGGGDRKAGRLIRLLDEHPRVAPAPGLRVDVWLLALCAAVFSEVMPGS